MSMNLKQITRIMVQFSPLAGNGASAREFLARIVCAQSSNPDCKIEQKVRLKGDPAVEIEFDNKEVTRLATSDMNVNEIVQVIKNRAEEMGMQEKLKSAGLSDKKFESSWLAGTKSHEIAGMKKHIPRQ